MITINKERFFYAILTIMLIDLVIDGIDDLGTTLYLLHLIRSVAIITLALLLSLSFKNNKNKKRNNAINQHD